MPAHHEPRAPRTNEPHTLTVSADQKQVQVAIPAVTGHHAPGERTAAAREALADEHLTRAERVIVTTPRGDTEVLDEVLGVYRGSVGP